MVERGYSRCLRYDPIQPVPQYKSAPRKSRMDGFQGTIFSIGTQTDSILDRFDLDDSLIPRLRVLTQTVRSGKWEASLRGPKFRLSYEQASKLTNAMMKDLGGVQNTMTKSSSSSCGLMILTIILATIIAAMAAFLYI